jgi:hypothetical protein
MWNASATVAERQRKLEIAMRALQTLQSYAPTIDLYRGLWPTSDDPLLAFREETRRQPHSSGSLPRPRAGPRWAIWS